MNGKNPSKPELHAPLRADLKAFLDGELKGWRKLRLNWHLSKCEPCREERDWLSQLGNDMQALEQAQPSLALRSRILASLPVEPPIIPMPMRAAPQFQPTARPRYALGMGFCALLLMSGAFAYGRYTSPKPANVTQQLSQQHSPMVKAVPEAKTPKAVKSEPIPIASIIDDPTSMRANQLVIQDLIREEKERKAAEALHRQRMRQVAKAVTRTTPATNLSMAPNPGGIPAEQIESVIRKSAVRFEANVKPIASAVAKRLTRELIVRLPSDRAEDFLAALNQIGSISKSVEPDPHRAVVVTPYIETPPATPRPSNVIMLQPGRDGIVTLRIKLSK